jgi:HD superfamily phosphodiesterase
MKTLYEIRQIVEKNIKPVYENEQTGHDWDNHIVKVINYGKKIYDYIRKRVEDGFEDTTIVDYRVLYLACVYHDISLAYWTGERDLYDLRETHHIDSANIFKMDAIKYDLNSVEAFIACKMIEEHRSSAKTLPSFNASGMLIEADKNSRDLISQVRMAILHNHAADRHRFCSQLVVDSFRKKYGKFNEYGNKLYVNYLPAIRKIESNIRIINGNGFQGLVRREIKKLGIN